MLQSTAVSGLYSRQIHRSHIWRLTLNFDPTSSTPDTNLVATSEVELERLHALRKESEAGKEGEMLEAAKRELALSDALSLSREPSPDTEMQDMEHGLLDSRYGPSPSRLDTNESGSSISLGQPERLSFSSDRPAGMATSTYSPTQWLRDQVDTLTQSPQEKSYSTFQSHRSRTSSISSRGSSMFDNSSDDANSVSVYSNLGQSLPQALLNSFNHPQLQELPGWPRLEIKDLDAASSRAWEDLERFMKEIVQCGEAGEVEEVSFPK